MSIGEGRTSEEQKAQKCRGIREKVVDGVRQGRAPAVLVLNLRATATFWAGQAAVWMMRRCFVLRLWAPVRRAHRTSHGRGQPTMQRARKRDQA